MTRRTVYLWSSLGVVLCVGLAVAWFQRDRGEAAFAEAKALLRVDLPEATELDEIDAALAESHLHEAQRQGMDPRRVAPLLAEAKALQALRDGQLSAARQHLVKAAHRFSWNRPLRVLAADVERRDGELDAAQGHLDEVFRGYPQDPRGIWIEGAVALEAGRPEVARENFRALLGHYADVAALHNQLALAEEALGNVAAAERALKRALELDPTLVEAWINRGRIALQTEDLAQAEAAFDRAIAVDRSSADAHLGRGLACLQREDNHACLPAAKQDFLQAHELSPLDPTPLSAVGDWYRLHDDPELALEHYRKAANLSEGDGSAWVKLGNTLQRQGQRDQAELAFREALRQEPGLASAHNGLGVVLLQAGRTEDAVRSLKRARRLDPEDPNPARNLAVIAQQT